MQVDAGRDRDCILENNDEEEVDVAVQVSENVVNMSYSRLNLGGICSAKSIIVTYPGISTSYVSLLAVAPCSSELR